MIQKYCILLLTLGKKKNIVQKPLGVNGKQSGNQERVNIPAPKRQNEPRIKGNLYPTHNARKAFATGASM